MNYLDDIEAMNGITSMVLKSSKIHGAIYVGNPGFGKSYNLMEQLREKLITYRLYKGEMSSRAFIDELQKYNNNVIILDDMDGCLQSSVWLNILKGALDNQTGRAINWITAHDDIRFSFTGKIFILTNSERDLRHEMCFPLLSRCMAYKLQSNNDDLKEYLREYIMDKGTLTVEQKEKLLKKMNESAIYDWRHLEQDLIWLEEAGICAPKLLFQ